MSRVCIMKKLIAKSKSMYLHRALKLSGATAAAQVISYAAMPLLTRLFSVDDYAVLALFFSWMLPLVVLSTLRIEFSIPDAGNDEESLLRRNLALRVSLVFSMGSAAVIASLWLMGVNFNPVFWLLPAGILVTSWSQVYNFFTTRTGEFTLNSWYRIIGNIGISGISIMIGYFFYHAYGLVVGFILGQLISLLVFVFFTKEPFRLSNVMGMHLNGEQLGKFGKYIFYNTPNGLLEVLQLSLIVFFLEGAFGAVVTGAFYLCWRILQAPSSLISNTIFLSQYANASEMNRNGKPFHGMVISTFFLLLFAALPFMLLLMVYGDNLFGFVFGEEWREAGDFASVLIIYFGLSFAVTPFNYVPLIKGKHRQLLMFSAADLLLRCGAFYLGYLNGSALQAILLFSLTGASFCIYYIIWYYRLASMPATLQQFDEK